jgi:hypothetical protein
LNYILNFSLFQYLMVHNERQLVVRIIHVVELRVIGPISVSFILSYFVCTYIYFVTIVIYIVSFQNIFPDEVHIHGYMNIHDATYRRWLRRLDREDNERSWIRNDFLEDFWDLQILFGDRVYEEERWG